MAVNMKPANSDEVREWANETGWRDRYDRPVADRGRLPSDLIDAFNAAHRRNRIEYNPVGRGIPQPPRSAQDSGNRGNTKAANARTERASTSTRTPARRSEPEAAAPAAPRARRSTSQVHNVAPAAVMAPDNIGDLMAALTAAGGEGVTLHATYRLEFDTASA